MILATLLATAYFYLHNTAGGIIVLTGEPCMQVWETLPLKRAYATDARGKHTEGCWRADADWVYIRYVTKVEVKYPKAEFQLGRTEKG